MDRRLSCAQKDRFLTILAAITLFKLAHIILLSIVVCVLHSRKKCKTVSRTVNAY